MSDQLSIENRPEFSQAPSTTKKRRGAPLGNQNALSHGFYSSRFKQAELSSLPKDFKGLTEEITMLRLLIRRQVDYVNQAPTLYDFNDAMRILCLSCFTLNRFLRTHLLLASSGQDEFSQAIDEALDMLAKDWHLE
jgi:hypothetical protein